MDRIGLIVLGICIIIAAVIISHPDKAEQGRYQMVPTSGVNVFVLDTATGRVWSRFVPSTEGNGKWEEEKDVPWKK
jgi:hypothetical protein